MVCFGAAEELIRTSEMWTLSYGTKFDAQVHGKSRQNINAEEPIWNVTSFRMCVIGVIR